MKIPKWLLPVISIVVALAVGIAAVIISGRFGPTDRVETNIEGETETTILYGPSGYGDDDVVDLPAGAIPSSPEVGTIEVSAGLPSDPGVTPLEDAVDRIAGGGAVGDDIPTIDGDTAGAAAAGDEPADSAEDPCIAAGDCPDGTVMGRIFALIAPPEFVVRVRAFVPDEICPAPAGGANLLVFMTRPSRVTVTVAPIEGGGRVVELEDETSVDVTRSWNEALADAESSDDLPLLFLCFVVEDLEPGVIYSAVANADSFDGASSSDTTEFNGAGPTHHPSLSIEPIGDGAAVAYAEHRADEQLAVRAWVLPEDATGTPNCFGSHDGETEVPWRYRNFSTLGVGETGNLLIPPEYDHRTAVAFQVPEGSTILFCAVWSPGADAPSWERAQSSYADGALLATTDYQLPKVTLVRVDMTSGFTPVDEVTVFGRTQEGNQCGGFSFTPAEAASVLPHVVCELEGASTSFDPLNWSYREVGFTGNIVIPSRVISGDNTYTGESTLSIGDFVCLGSCPTNPSMRYTVPLAEIDGVSAGTATLQVTWEQGNSNGLVRPVVSDVPQREGVLEAADGGVLEWANPMMDTDERMAFDHVDPSTLSGVAALHLVTDRPVDYTVSLEALRHEDCAVGGATLSVSGHSDGETDVEIPGLCFGSFYWATVHLTDEYGTSTTFSASRGGVTQWLASLIRVPKADVRVEFTAVTTTPADSAIVPGSYLTMDGTSIPLGSRTCTDDGHITSSGIVVVPLTSHPVVDVHIATVPELTNDGVYCSGILAPDAITVAAEGTFELDLASIREASGGTTVTIGGLTFIVTILA